MTSTLGPTILTAYAALHERLLAEWSVSNSGPQGNNGGAAAQASSSYSAHLLHPFGPYPSSPSATPPDLASVSAALRSFATNTLPPSTAPDVGSSSLSSTAEQQQINKLLTLLREQAQSTAALAVGAGGGGEFATVAKRLLCKRDEDAVAAAWWPAHNSALAKDKGKQRAGSVEDTARTLERVSAELGLVSFRDEDVRPGSVKLSVGGQIMVVDVELPVTASSGSVKISYALSSSNDSTTKLAPKLAIRLSRVLGRFTVDGDGGDLEWRSVRAQLRLLKTLDDACFRGGRDGNSGGAQTDWFAAQEALESGLEVAFTSAAPSDDDPLSQWQPRMLSNAFNGYGTLVDADPICTYSATPLARLLTTGQQARSGDEGVYCMRFRLDFGSGGNQVEAKLEPPVPISSDVGRRMLSVMRGIEGTANSSKSDESLYALPGSAAGTAWMEDLLLASDLADPEYKLKRYGPDSPTVDHRVDEGIDSNPACSFRLAQTGSIRSFLCTHVRFSSDGDGLKKLASLLRILQQQIYVNELVRSALLPSRKSTTPNAATSLYTGISAAALSLDTPSSSVPVHVHLLNSAVPAVALSFPHPQSGNPCAVTLEPPAVTEQGGTGSWQVELDGAGFSSVDADEKKRKEERLRRAAMSGRMMEVMRVMLQ